MSDLPRLPSLLITAALLGAGAPACSVADPTPRSVVRTWILLPTAAGMRLGGEGLVTQLRTELAAAPAASRQPNAAITSLAPLDATRYTVTLTCTNDAACERAAQYLGERREWVADWSPDNPVSRPRAPMRGSAL